MSEEHRQAMMRYLDATYACRDVARLLREAQEALSALCGARAVQVGTANFTDTLAMPKIVSGMNEWLDGHGIRDVNELRAALIV